MCNFYIYGKIPTERNELKINYVDIKTQTIQKLSIGEIMRNNKINSQDIVEVKILVSDNKFDIRSVDPNLFYQTIDNNEIFKIHDYNNDKYEYFDDDLLIQEGIFTISLINDIIASNCNYFLICITYVDKRKIRVKKINDKIVEDINYKI